MSNKKNIDTNVDNYTFEELLIILGLTKKNADQKNIIEKTNKLIDKFCY